MSSSEAGGSAVRDGYKEVQLGPKTYKVPETWRKAKIHEVTETVTRGKQPDYADNSATKVVNQSCIYWDGFREDELKFLKDDVAAEWKDKYFVHEGDILLNSTGKGTLGRAFYWDRDTDDYVLDSHVTRISTKHQETHPAFFRYYLESTHGQTMLYTYCVSGSTGQIELSKTDLNGMPVLLPPLPEQRRIADILSTVDEEIQQTDEIIEKTQQVKRGLEQDLVIGQGLGHKLKEVRLGAKTVEIPESWGLSTFSELAEIRKGNTPKTDNQDYFGGDIVWVTPNDLSNLYENGEKYISDSERKITEEGLQSCSTKIIEPNSVMFTSRSYGIGKTTICTVPAATNQGIMSFECGSEVSEEYLYYYLNYIMDYIVSLSGVSTFPEVSKSDISSITVPVPPEEDQERIVSTLKKVDAKIIYQREHKQHLQELKRGLMQDLLTGQVRVTPDD